MVKVKIKGALGVGIWGREGLEKRGIELGGGGRLGRGGVEEGERQCSKLQVRCYMTSVYTR